MFFPFIQDLDRSHGLTFTDDGVVIADGNGMDSRDIPPENLFSSIERTAPSRFVHIEEIADESDLDGEEFTVSQGGPAEWIAQSKAMQAALARCQAAPLSIPVIDQDLDPDDDTDVAETDGVGLFARTVRASGSPSSSRRDFRAGMGWKLNRPVSAHERKLLARP
jgi:hypothetical protein